MSKHRDSLFPLLIIFIISVFSVIDLFVNIGRSANMDGLVHITTVAQFTDAFKSGDFPIIWLDGFANYGMPIGLFAQQLTSYLGMLFNLVVNDPVLAYNIVAFLGILLSNIFFYYFLRLYFNPLYALIGAIFLNFAPFRILDLYIRGAIPETFSTIFLPLILISIYNLIHKKKIIYFYYLTLSICGLILTHPMMFVTYSFIFIPYFIFNIITTSGFKITRQVLVSLGVFIVAMVIALGISAYYLIPLNMELKYVFYGSEKNHLLPNHYMGLENYFNPNWYYFYKDDIFPRGHFIKSGLIETVAIIIGLLTVCYRIFKGLLKKQVTILEFAVATGLLIIFFTLPYSDFIYQKVSFLGNIQFPWRMFSAFIFIPPIIIAYVLQKLDRKAFVIALILLVCLVRFPQVYGKNYTAYPLSTYTFTPINLHSNNLNTIWTGKTDEYPIKKEKVEIVGGQGKVVSKTIKNSSRQYTIEAYTDVHVADYTFYFPGWTLYIDGKESPIQFQDPNYRGVITYTVPQGKHDVVLRFEDTRIRSLGKAITVGFILLLGTLFLLRRQIAKLYLKYV